VRTPPGNWLLLPVALGAVEGGNEIRWSTPRKGSLWGVSEHAGRNASERRAGLEKGNVGAEPPE